MSARKMLSILYRNKIAAVDVDEELSGSDGDDDMGNNVKSYSNSDLYLENTTTSFRTRDDEYGVLHGTPLQRLYDSIARGDVASCRKIVKRDVSILHEALDSFIQVQKGAAIHICEAPVLPGTHTGDFLHEGEICEFTDKQTVQYMHSDGKMYAIDWFQLAGDHGWVHDFSADNPPEPSIKILIDCTPVLYAVKLKKVAILRYFFSRHAIDCGRKALFTAIEQADLNSVETMLTMNPAFINEPYGESRTPLIYAIVKNAYDAVAMLVSLADVDLMWKDKDGDTALHWLARTGPADLVSRLAKFQAQFNAQNNQGQTPLMYALEAKKGEVALALLQQGAMTLDASVVDNNGDTALHLAMSNGMVRIVQVIATKYHETIDVNAQNNEMMTPLMLGLEIPNLDATAALLESAFLSLDIDQLPNDDDLTALDIAKRVNNADILRAMTEVGAWQSLRGAILRNDNVDMTETLRPLSSGLCSQPLDEMGNTALILAATKGNSALVRQLLASCRDAGHLHQFNHAGQCAFDVALQHFISCFRRTVNADAASTTNTEHTRSEEYSRVAWAILCKGNRSARWLSTPKKRGDSRPDASSSLARWRRTARNPRRRIMSAFRRKRQSPSSRRPASAPSYRRPTPRVPTTPRRHLFQPSRAQTTTSWKELTRASPQPTLTDLKISGDNSLHGHGDDGYAATQKHKAAPQLNVSVQQFVDWLRIIREVVDERTDQEEAWHTASGLILAIAIAVMKSAAARHSPHNLQLVDVSAKDWTTMAGLHLRAIAPREEDEALQDAEKLLQDTSDAKGSDGELQPAFVALANRKVAQSHAVKLFELMVELKNHEALERHVLPHIKHLLKLHLDATTSDEHTPLLQHLMATLRSRQASQRGLYSVVLGRLFNDTGWQPFLRHTERLAAFCARIEGTGDAPTQTESDLLQSYFVAYQILPRFNVFLQRLAAAAGGQAVMAGVKAVFRFIERAALFAATTKDPAGDDADGATEKWSSSHILDATRGSIVLPNMHSMNMTLGLLAAASANDALRDQARERGWVASAFDLGEKVELVQVRQTFSRPLRSGWADCVVLFRFHSDNPKLCPIMELRLLHLDLANVRERADTYLEYRTMRSAQELLCYSKGVLRSPESDHTETDVSPAAAKSIEAAAATSSTAVRAGGHQDDQQRELLEQQLSATRLALRQANGTVEDVKAELEEARAARGAMMEQLHKSTAELQVVKSEWVKNRTELANAKVELQSVNETTKEVLKQLRETTTEMQMIKSEWIKTRTELDKTKVKLQAVSETTKEMKIIKSEWAKSQTELLNTKAKLRSVSSKAQQNAAGVKAAKAANTQLTETSQLLLKLVLKTTRHAKNRSRKAIRSP